MVKEDQSKSKNFLRQIVIDDIKRLGTSAVRVMAEDLRKAGQVEKAELVDSLVNEYISAIGSSGQ